MEDDFQDFNEKLKLNSRGIYKHGKVTVNSKPYYLEEYPRNIIIKYSDEFAQMLANYHLVTVKKSIFPAYRIHNVSGDRRILIYSEYLTGTTLKDYFKQKRDKDEVIEREFIRSLLSKMVTVVKSLSSQNLVHRKLSLSKIFITTNRSEITDIKIIGAKYLKPIGSKYIELDNWVTLPNELINESPIAKRTAFITFAYFLGEILTELIRTKKIEDDILFWQLFNLRRLLLNPGKEENDWGKINAEIKHIKIGTNLNLKELKKDYLITRLERKMTEQYRKILDKCKKLNNEKDFSVYRLVDYFTLCEENKVILIENSIPDSYIALQEYIRSKKVEEKDVIKILNSLMDVVRSMNEKKLIYHQPFFTNLYVDTKGEKVYIKEDNNHTVYLFEEEILIQALAQIISSLPFCREEIKSNKEKGRDWKDLAYHLINGQWELEEPSISNFFDTVRKEVEKLLMYEILKDNCLGEGSFGKVYKCSKKDTNESFACKIFESKNYFNEECERLKQAMKCRNVTRYKDSFKCGNNYYLVLELLDSDLLKHINENKPITLETVCIVAKYIGFALRDMHSYEIIHTDVKLANVFISYDKKNGDRIKKVELGDLGKTEGTPFYNPGRKEEGMRKDIKAYGITLLLLLSNKQDNDKQKKYYCGKISTEELDDQLREPISTLIEQSQNEEQAKEILNNLKRMIEACIGNDKELTMERIMDFDFFKCFHYVYYT